MEEKEILEKMPLKMTVSKGPKGWFVTANFNVVAVEGGFTCDSATACIDRPPSLNDAIAVAMDFINSKTDARILSGYQWSVLHGKDSGRMVNVYLSKENRENIKAKYDLAISKPELVPFPLKYKISEEEDTTPIYEYFQNASELEAFHIGSLNFIDSCINEGWSEKDAARAWFNE